ncbi:purine-nucleoside phosphorylase [Niabella terrae]
MAQELIERVLETTAYLKAQSSLEPQVAIVLGSGLGDFARQIDIEQEVAYHDIPNFPVSTVQGHSGKLIFGRVSGKPVVAMSGRFHYYEGYSPQEVVFPIRVFKQLGVQTLLLSNAAGAVHPDFRIGDIMIINDHISFGTPNPLIGKNVEEWGPRFPDMSEPYKKDLIRKALDLGRQLQIPLQQGVYFAVTGPTFETRAEYRLIKIVGADVVGMSTVQECIVANHMGMQVFAASVVTDLGIREQDNTITHEEVLEAANAAAPRLARIFSELIKII